MAWSAGTFSRVHDWTTDEAGSFPNIQSDRMDEEDDNLAAGINDCLHAGGQNSMSGDLNLNGNGLINADQLEIQDAGATDSVTFSHNGTNLLATGVNTTVMDLVDMGMRIRDGSQLTVFDSTDTDSISVSHNGTNAVLGFVGTTALQVRDGVLFQVLDSGNTESLTINVSTNKVIDSNDGALIIRALGSGELMQMYTDSVGSTGERLRLGNGVAYFLNAPALRVYDSSNTLYLQLSHNGSDGYVQSFAGNLVLDAANNIIQCADGDSLRVYDSGGTDYLQLSHNGSNGRIETNAGSIQLSPADSVVQVLGGTNVRVFDATNNDYLQLSHDGTDANISFAGTARMNIAGDVEISSNSELYMTSDSSAIRMGAGEDVDLIFDGTSFLVRTASGPETMIAATPNADVALHFNNTENLRTSDHTASDAVTGAQVRHFDLSFYDVGLATIPTVNVGVARDLLQSDFSKRLSINNNIVTLTQNSAFPVGGFFYVFSSSGSSTIAQGSGVTITDVVAGTTGSTAIGPLEGRMVIKVSDTEYHIGY